MDSLESWTRCSTQTGAMMREFVTSLAKLCAILTISLNPLVAKEVTSQSCRLYCLEKVASYEICEKSCHIVTNIISGTNISRPDVSKVPSPPRLVSSGYHFLTFDWEQYLTNTTPVVYILEVTRRPMNKSNPKLFYPHYERYRRAVKTTYKMEKLQSNMSYSVRLAAVCINGTSNFSDHSRFYTTKSSCDIEAQEKSKVKDKCSLVHNITVLLDFIRPNKYRSPQINITIRWVPIEGHENFNITFDITFKRIGSNCDSRNVLHLEDMYHVDKKDESNPSHSFQTSNTVLGCHYQVQFMADLYEPHDFETHSFFFFPDCLDGICWCKTGSYYQESEYINYELKQSSKNTTELKATWNIAGWERKSIVYFRAQLRLYRVTRKDVCIPKRWGSLDVDFNKTVETYSVTWNEVTENCSYIIKITAYNNSNCPYVPLQHKFKAQFAIPSSSPPSLSTVKAQETTKPRSERPSVGPTTNLSTDPFVAYKKDQSSGVNTTAIAVSVPLVWVVLLAFTLVFLWTWRRRKKEQSTAAIITPTGLRRLGDSDTDINVYFRNHNLSPTEFYHERSQLMVELPSKNVEGMEINWAYVEQRIADAIETGETDEFEFSFHRLELGHVLGKGAFGKVFIAEAYGICGDSGRKTVAVKKLKENASQDEIDDFKAEIDFMKTIGIHENIVTMLGCCTMYPPVCLIVEYVPNGDLLHYLRDMRKKFEKEKEKERQLSAHTEESKSTLNSHSSLSDTTKSYQKLFSSDANLNRKKSLSAASISATVGLATILPRKSEFRQSFEMDGSIGEYVGRRSSSSMLENTEQTTLPVTGVTLDGSPTSTGSKRIKCSKQQNLEGALDPADLQSFAYQIANGMAYLSARGIIHRDLAARNILVGENKVLKVSDFGLSKEGEYVKKSVGKIPLRWLSLEAMRERFYSSASDVWAFGIVLWEICTLGGFPYPTISDRDLLKFLLQGKRMEKPNNCTDEIYELMMECWAGDPDERPTFHALRELLWKFQEEDHSYVNLDDDIVLPPTAEDSVSNDWIAFGDDDGSENRVQDDVFEPAKSKNNLKKSSVSNSFEEERPKKVSEEEENETSKSSKVPIIQLENVGFERDSVVKENTDSENDEASGNFKNGNLPDTAKNAKFTDTPV